VALRRDHRGPKALKLYLDSSAWAKLFVAEPGADDMLPIWDEADEVFCVSIGYLEVRTAITRRLPARAAGRARRLLDEYWQEVETVAVDEQLIGLAVRVADILRLRTLDALHLAAAQQIRDVRLVFATWDRELAQAAAAAGFAVLP
jgi:uncharacterized protein